MEILHSEVVPVRPGTTPDYDHNNPMARVLEMVEGAGLAAGREAYPFDELQYLFPIRSLQLYGPSAPSDGVLDPQQQDNKTDFQKQNVASFLVADTQLIRGIASAGGVERAVPSPVLSRRSGFGAGRHGTRFAGTDDPAVPEGRTERDSQRRLSVPYDAETGRYAIELWGWPGTPADLRAALDPRGQAAFDRNALIAAPSLVPGNANAFLREALDDRFVNDVAPDHAHAPDAGSAHRGRLGNRQ